MMDIVCIANIEWGSTWQRHQSFMTALSQAGHNIYFINNSGFTSPQFSDIPRLFSKYFGKKTKNNTLPSRLKLFNPLVIPPRIIFGDILNAKYFIPKLVKNLKQNGLSQNIIFYTFLPTNFSMKIISVLNPQKIIYDYVSDFFSHPKPPKNLTTIHTNLLNKADVVLTDSSKLHSFLSLSHKNVFELHHGVSQEFLQIQWKPFNKTPSKICYFGTVNSEILDYSLLNSFLKAGYNLTLIGPLKGTPPSPHPNLELIPQVAVSKLADLLNLTDLIILPYKQNPFNASVMPAKIFQCLATGKPIIVSGLPLLKKDLNQYFYFLDDMTDCQRMIDQIVLTESPELAFKRQAFAKLHSEELIHKKLISIIFND